MGHTTPTSPSPLPSLSFRINPPSLPFGIHIPLSSPIWTLIERLYRLPPPPPRVRDPKKPMQVLCVGLPRSGTESLQKALLHLGYDHTYHGWDIVYDSEIHSPGWVKLYRKKFLQGLSPTAEEFDALLGHSVAVTDAAASVFASEMIEAYPEAKVILNVRGDTEKWEESLRKTLVRANQSWGFWIASWLDRECFWAWHVYERCLWMGLFRVVDGDFAGGVGRNGWWIAREHTAMIRGLVPPERLLEWDIEDGWGPLCAFLNKPIPSVPFPHANAASSGWKAREEQCNKRWVDHAFINLILIFFLLIGGTALTRIFLF